MRFVTHSGEVIDSQLNYHDIHSEDKPVVMRRK
jgi:hypothetical protein